MSNKSLENGEFNVAGVCGDSLLPASRCLPKNSVRPPHEVVVPRSWRGARYLLSVPRFR